MTVGNPSKWVLQTIPPSLDTGKAIVSTTMIISPDLLQNRTSFSRTICLVCIGSDREDQVESVHSVVPILYSVDPIFRF